MTSAMSLEYFVSLLSTEEVKQRCNRRVSCLLDLTEIRPTRGKHVIDKVDYYAHYMGQKV